VSALVGGGGRDRDVRMSDQELREWFAALAEYQAHQLDPLQNELNRLVRRGAPRLFRASVWPALLRAVPADVDGLLSNGHRESDDELLVLDLARCEMEDSLKIEVRRLCMAIAPAAKYEQGGKRGKRKEKICSFDSLFLKKKKECVMSLQSCFRMLNCLLQWDVAARF
jgi:hypothetical protein